MMERISGEEMSVKGSVGHILNKGQATFREGKILTIPEDEEYTQDGHPWGKLFSF